MKPTKILTLAILLPCATLTGCLNNNDNSNRNNNTGTMHGIHLLTNNPTSIIYQPDAGLFVQSSGSYGAFPDYIPEFNGGLERIFLDDYSTDIIVDDGDADTHPYGLTTNLALFSDISGYFVGYENYGDNSLRKFNPSTGAVDAGVIATLDNVDIRNINAGPSDTLWVSVADSVNPRVLVIDSSDVLIDEITTSYNPVGVTFSNDTAFINTVANDYSDANIELVDLSVGVLSGNLTASAGSYQNTLSDYTVTSYGDNFYRIGRYNIDLITKYATGTPATAVYSYSTIDSPSDPTSNPYQLVFLNDTKAYLLRYNSNIMWIVNPSAATEEAFKIGEIDLSDYDDGDGSPEMSDGVIVDGKLYVTLQRQNYFAVIPGNSYVAVIDTITDTEIPVN